MPTFLSNATSFFTADDARAKMEEVYQAYLDRIPTSTGIELLSIETSYGHTNVLQMGAPGDPALVILHARNSCAPLAVRHFLSLLPQFRIYAIDLPGQPNLSAEVRLPSQTNAYGQWLHEILSKLGIWYANLVGIELGAYAALKSLTFDARRVAAAYLVTPLGLHATGRWQHYWRQRRPIARFTHNPSPKKLEQLAKRMWQEVDDEMLDFWSIILPDYAPDYDYLSAISSSTLSGLATPIYCFVGSENYSFSPRAKYQQIPSLQSITVLPNSGYLPSPAAYERIVKHIQNTFQEHRKDMV